MNVPSLLKIVMVCSLKTNLFQYEVIDSSCNETERYPYANGYSVTVFASVKQARRYYRTSWSNQHFNFFFFPFQTVACILLIL